MIKKFTILALLCITFGCACPESETLKDINATILPEYKSYLEKDPYYKKPENKNALKIRLLHLKTIEAVIDARQD